MILIKYLLGLVSMHFALMTSSQRWQLSTKGLYILMKIGTVATGWTHSKFIIYTDKILTRRAEFRQISINLPEFRILPE